MDLALKRIPKLAFFDIDGTLLGSSGTLSQRCIDAVQNLSQQGVLCALASGRASFAAQHLLQQLPISAPCMFFAGAYVVDPTTNQSLLEHILAPALVQQSVAVSRQNGLYVELYSKDGYFIEAPSHLTDIHSEYLGRPPTVMPFDEVIRSKCILKMETVSEGAAQNKLNHSLEKFLPEIQCGCAGVAGHPDLLFNNLTSRSASRIAGFDFIVQHLNIAPGEVVSFGDSPADMVFIERSGLGVAMGNASDQVKSAANYITDHVDEDGLAQAIERLFLS